MINLTIAVPRCWVVMSSVLYKIIVIIMNT